MTTADGTAGEVSIASNIHNKHCVSSTLLRCSHPPSAGVRLGRIHTRTDPEQFLLGLHCVADTGQPAGTSDRRENVTMHVWAGMWRPNTNHTMDGVVQLDGPAGHPYADGTLPRRLLSMHSHGAVKVGASDGTRTSGIDHLFRHAGRHCDYVGRQRVDCFIVHGMAGHFLLFRCGEFVVVAGIVCVRCQFAGRVCWRIARGARIH